MAAVQYLCVHNSTIGTGTTCLTEVHPEHPEHHSNAEVTFPLRLKATWQKQQNLQKNQQPQKGQQTSLLFGLQLQRCHDENRKLTVTRTQQPVILLASRLTDDMSVYQNTNIISEQSLQRHGMQLRPCGQAGAAAARCYVLTW